MRISLSFTDLTDALVSLNGAAEQFAGMNMWRQQEPVEKLSVIDPELAQEIPYAPSKKIGNPDSLWAKFHFGIMMPNFSRMENAASDPELVNLRIADDEASRYFQFIKDLKQHIANHQELTKGIDYLIERLPQHAEELPALMRGMDKDPALKGTRTADFFRELADYFPPASTALLASLQEIGGQVEPPLRRHSDFFVHALDALPEYAKLGPVFSQLLKDAQRQKNEDGSLKAGNHLIGRILQAYYADKKGVPFEQLGLDARAKGYFKGKGIYERTLDYVQELSNCPVRPDKDGKVGDITASQVLTLYSSWYRKPAVVEMPTPEFIGAAAAAVNQFRIFLQTVKEKTHGRIDLGAEIESEGLEQMQGDDDMLRRLGRMAMSMDAGGNKPGAQLKTDSAVLMRFAKSLWPQEQRKKVWGSTECYVPSLGRSFDSFKQDIATLLFATALNVENNAPSRVGDVKQRLEQVAVVKALAKDIKDANNIDAIRALLASSRNREAIAYLKRDAMAMESNPELLHSAHAASGIHFVSIYFGLEKPAPIPISETEILKGFQALKHDKSAGKFVVHYQEAGKEVQCEIPVASAAIPPQITYHEKSLEDGDGLIYPAYLTVRHEGKPVIIPVVGRTSYDPMGESGSAHAGEVIGFGCSMHHSSLQYALAKAAGLGAEKEELVKLKDTFMSIDPALHLRRSLAEFQVEQVISAFATGQAITYREWITQHGQATLDIGNQHSRDFVSNGGYTPSYHETLAALALSYPELYPATFSVARDISPRSSFYDGRDVSLPSETRGCVLS